MFDPICPLCCKTFVECERISACHCGHAFHHDCIQSFLDATRKFKGCRGCPVCGEDRERGERTPASRERGTGRGEVGGMTDGERRSRCRWDKVDYLIQLKFVFPASTEAARRRSTPPLSDRQSPIGETAGWSERANCRLLGEIRGLEGKLKAVISMMNTMREQRDVLQSTLGSRSEFAFFPSASTLTICNRNNNRALLASDFAAKLSRDDDDTDAGQSIMAGFVRLASHMLLDYAKFPAALRNYFGSLKNPRRRREEVTIRTDHGSEANERSIGHEEVDGRVIVHGEVFGQFDEVAEQSNKVGQSDHCVRGKDKLYDWGATSDRSIDCASDPLQASSPVFLRTDHGLETNGQSIGNEEVDGRVIVHRDVFGQLDKVAEQSNKVRHFDHCLRGKDKLNDGGATSDRSIDCALDPLQASSPRSVRTEPLHADGEDSEFEHSAHGIYDGGPPQPTGDIECQTDFWYESEWDEDLYEVDWDYEPFENG